MTTNRFTYTKDQRRALDTFVKITRAANAVNARAQGFTASGLSISQFGVLEALYHLGPQRQNELARKILKTSGNLTMVLDNLEKRELILRTREVEDRRALQVNLTPKGEALIAEIFPAHADEITRAMSTLSQDEQDELARLCSKLGNQQTN